MNLGKHNISSQRRENWRVWRKGEGEEHKNGRAARKQNRNRKVNSSLVYIIDPVQHD